MAIQIEKNLVKYQDLIPICDSVKKLHALVHNVMMGLRLLLLKDAQMLKIKNKYLLV